jgi:hypothetical protein
LRPGCSRGRGLWLTDVLLLGVRAERRKFVDVASKLEELERTVDKKALQVVAAQKKKKGGRANPAGASAGR